ncbi:MAG: heme-binding protein [Bilifractor sp.]|jgi:uncharacterized protein GlcG (DUF336 family)
MAIQTNDPRLTLVAGGYPIFAQGKIVGGIGVRLKKDEEQSFCGRSLMDLLLVAIH